MRTVFLVLANDHCTGSVRAWTTETSYKEAEKYLNDVVPKHPSFAFWIQKAVKQDWESHP